MSTGVNPALESGPRAIPTLPAAVPDRVTGVVATTGWPGAAWVALPNSRGVATLLGYALAALSREPRWVAWIAPPRRPSKAELGAYGLDTSRVLVIPAPVERDPLPLAERLLLSGHYSAVLVWPHAVDAERLASVQQAAMVGNAVGIVFPPEA